MADRPADRPARGPVTSTAADSSGGSTDTVKVPIIPPPPPPKEPRKPLAQRLQAALGTGSDAKSETSAAPRSTTSVSPAPPVEARSPVPQAAPDVVRRPVTAMPPTTTAPTNGKGPSAAPVVADLYATTPRGPVRPAEQPVTAPVGRAPARKPRRARLRLTRIDPWSVMKTAFLLSIALGIVTVVSVLMVWTILGAAGVWDSINATVASVLGGEDGSGFNIQDYVGTSRIMGLTILISLIDVALLTAIATLAAFLYNLAAALLGGIEVTLAED